MLCKLPYFEDRPHVPIVIKYKGKRTRFLPLLDSGADFSVFYKADAARIGLDWSKGKNVELTNADGSSFKAKQFDLILEIEGYSFRSKICFIDNKLSSMPLLGRTDVFDKFKITIFEKDKYVELKSL